MTTKRKKDDICKGCSDTSLHPKKKELSPLTAAIAYSNGAVFFGKDWISFLSHEQIESAILKYGSPIPRKKG